MRLVDELGVKWHPIPANPRRIVPHLELFFVYKLFLACQQFKPDMCLTYTPRVNCYITLVPLKILSIKLIRNISGVGDSLDSEKKLQSMLAKFLYRRARNTHWTFFQNDRDMQLGLAEGFSNKENTSLLPGSGVDLEQFNAQPRDDTKPLRFMMAARLIPAKGYLDFIELALQYASNSSLEFHLVGTFSEESGISREEFDALINASGVVYHGYTEDLVPFYQQSDMFVLPSSYGEGLPRVLLEAAACGCALLAYDNAGSNRAINHGVNGWTCTEPTVAAMVQIVSEFSNASHSERQAMSIASRQHVENGFSEQIVIDSYLDLLGK